MICVFCKYRDSTQPSLLLEVWKETGYVLFAIYICLVISQWTEPLKPYQEK